MTVGDVLLLINEVQMQSEIFLLWCSRESMMSFVLGFRLEIGMTLENCILNGIIIYEFYNVVYYAE